MENNNQDEFIVIIEKMGNRFYYKNGILHREAGPAYVPWKLKEEFTGLADQELYKKVFQLHAKEDEYDGFASDGSPITMRARPDYVCYHLDGKEYQLEEFNAIMLEKELSKEIPKQEVKTKKVKI